MEGFTSKSIAETIESTMNETIEAIVKKKTESMVESIFSDVLSGYGDISKKLKAKISSELDMCLDKLSIENYNVMISNCIDQAVQEELASKITDRIKSSIGDSISLLDCKTYKLSDIVDRIKNELMSDGQSDDHITVIVDFRDSTMFTSIYFDKESDVLKRDCKYSIDINRDNKVWRMSPDVPPTGLMYDIERLLFSLYANKTEIIIDDYDTYYGRED